MAPIAEVVVGRDRRQKSAVRQAVVRFAASSVVLFLALVAVSLVLASHIARQEALRDARVKGSAIGNLVAAPLVNAQVRAHLPGATSELTTVLRNRMSDGSVTHVRLWSQDGEVLWSDQKSLVGRRFILTREVSSLFGTRDVTAAVTTLRGAGNPGEQVSAGLLDVYAGTQDAGHLPMVFEAYFSGDSMRADERAIFTGYLPIVIAALLLFQVSVLPLALSLARRVERGQAERSSWMRHALLASDLERRRIAQDLHDGVIQDLAGLSYALPVLQAELSGDSATPAARAMSQQFSHILARDVAALRLLITDIYPPNLEGQGLATAIQDLARSAGKRGLEVRVGMAPDLAVPVETARLAYRVVREGLRNIAKHAQATIAMVEIGQVSEDIVVSVSDNGSGVLDRETPRGHLGLRLLEDAVGDLGGQISLRSLPSGGAELRASFPVNLIQP